MVTGFDRVPLRSMRRARNCARDSGLPPEASGRRGANSIQLAIADPSGSNSTSTRPSVPPSSTRIGGEKLLPASCEKAAYAWPWSFFAVNHDIATRLPLALNDGPFTGQAAIFQLSVKTACGAAHL